MELLTNKEPTFAQLSQELGEQAANAGRAQMRLRVMKWATKHQDALRSAGLLESLIKEFS